ncbi:MAG TPA: helix-turn-helix domain-containing protein [Patescibacteria group bacterium]
MNEVIYESLGLSPNEAKIYEALVEHGESGISDIAVFAKIHRRNAYDAIARLIDKGLCFEIISTKENRYNGVDPDKLTELLSEKQLALQKILPELKKKFAHRVAPQEAYIFRGYEGQKNIWRDIIRVGQEVCNIGAKGQWFDEKLASSRESFFKEVNRKKIKINLLLDQEIKTLPDFTKNYPAKLFNYRYLPKEYSTNSVTNIFGDYVVTYTGIEIGKMKDDTAFFVIHSKDLAESYRKWFWYMWKQSEVNKGNR